jgi:CRP/FNR family transcriptional regulator
MPSARQIKADEFLREQSDGIGLDLCSLLHELHASNVSRLNSLYGRGRVLFADGEMARGVYILRAGWASISVSSSEGRVVILRIAQAGDVLGLNSVLQNGSYDTTVRALQPCRTDFISRAQLMELMERSPRGAPAIVRMLSNELAELTDRARLLLLPQTARGRLARWLLQACSEANGRVDRVFTQEEIAQMICSSRETVTRQLASLSKEQVIRVTADSILICDRLGLEKIALAG